MAIWGGTWPSAKVVSGIAAPEVAVFWRFLVTTAGFLPLVLFSRSSLRMPRGTLLLTAAAALAVVLYNLAFFAGLRRGFAGAGGVLVPTLTPLITFLLTLPARRRAVKRREAIGLALGLAGGIVILQVWRLDARDILASGNLFFLLCAALWSAVTILSQKAQERADFIGFSFVMYAGSTLVALPFALPFGIASVFPAGPRFWLNLAYLALLGTAFATTVYFLASSRLGSNRTSSFLFIIPTAALLLSWALLGEAPSVPTIAGGACAIAAVYLVNRRAGEGSGEAAAAGAAAGGAVPKASTSPRRKGCRPQGPARC